MDPNNEIFISAASGYEIAIKRALGKLETMDDLNAQVEKEGFAHLPVTFFHAEQAGKLPLHHRDPFDRILIAQAQAEGLVLVSRDASFHHYGIHTMTA